MKYIKLFEDELEDFLGSSYSLEEILEPKEHYTAFGKAIGVDIAANPDLVATKYPLLSAAWFFSKNCLSKCKDASDASVLAVTKCVNGGTIGLADRQKHFKEYYHLLA